MPSGRQWIRGDERAIAWIVPNTKDAPVKHLDHYLVTIGEIEKLTVEKLSVTGDAKWRRRCDTPSHVPADALASASRTSAQPPRRLGKGKQLG